jgi:arylsulfatase A
MMKKIKLSIFLVLAMAFSSRAAASTSFTENLGRPNILLILADDMGYGDLSCYGATNFLTPNIDRLAKEGVLFTDGHAGASTCTPTRYAMLTGRHTWRTWLKYSALSTSGPLLIEEGRMTLASMLKEEGYNTSIVGKWHLGFGREAGFEENRTGAPNTWETRGKGPDWNGVLKPGPMECGFDSSYVFPIANSFPPYVIVEGHRVAGLREDSPIGKMESKNCGAMEGGEGARWKDEDLADLLTEKTVSELERFAKEEKPFFLYYSPPQPHLPHRPGPRFKGTSKAGAYGDVIQELDWSVGEILKTLDRLGLAENTLVIYSSDNGAGHTAKTLMKKLGGEHSPNGVLSGMKGDAKEGGVRVPFMARWPGKIKPGARSDELISLTDLMATFAAILDKDLPSETAEDSHNALPELLGKPSLNPDRPVVFSSGATGVLTLRAGKWKYIAGQGDCGYFQMMNKAPHPAPKPGDPLGQLYNLEEDIGETNNLYNEYPELVESMKRKLEEIKNAKR